MTNQLEYRCTCGAVKGIASGLIPGLASHLVCLCDDCQSFAAYLGRDDLLDAAGGTDVFQSTPSQLSISSGHEQLACVRLGPNGMLRWYASCCMTPLGNCLPQTQAAYVGVPVIALHASLGLEKVLGPVKYRVNARYARPGVAEVGHQKAPFAVIFKTLLFLLKGWLRRQYQPSPFVSSQGIPLVAPTTLSLEQRKKLAPGWMATGN